MAFNPQLFKQLMRIKRTKQTFSFLIKVVALLSAIAVAGVGGYTAYKNFVEKPECTEHVDANGDNICDVCEAVLEGTDEHVHEFAPATCTTPSTCECGATEGEALGHTVVTDAAVEPTCNETGLTAGEHCSVCDEVLVAQTVIEATGHSYADGSCGVCGAEDPDYVAPHEHSYESAVTAPTCTEAGYTTYTCSCGDSYVADEVAALGHSFTEGVCGVCGAEDPDYVKPVEKVWTLITELKTGDIVLIGNAANGKLLSALKVSAGSFYNKGVDYSATDFGSVTDDEKWVVTVNEDGSYSFTALNGDKLALAESYSSLNATGVHDKWTLVDKGNGVYNLKNAGRGNYLEWYASKGNWSTYSSISGNLFEISFYALREPVSHEHSYESTVTAPTCTEAGYTTYTCSCGDSYVADEVAALGHSFTEGVCGVCGAEDPDYVKPIEKVWTLITELKTGDIVLLGNAANGKLLSALKVSAGSFYNKGVDYSATDFGNVTDDEKWVVTVNEDGSYSFTALNGDKLALAESYSSLNATGVHDKWTLVDKGNGVYNLKNAGRGNYLEWYASKGNWSTYSSISGNLFEISFYALREPVSHEHSYESAVTAPTCTEAGYTTYTCSCGDSYVADEVAALGHSFTEGVCGTCGAEDPDYVKPDEPSVPAGGEADFDSIVTSNANGDSSYTKTFTTANGWVVQYAAIQSGGATNMNPQFTVIGPDNTHKAVCLVGKTSAPGKLTSPTLKTGISKLTINYTKMFTDTQLSVTVTVTELATGTKYTHDITVTLDKNDKYNVYTDVWTLDTPVVGDFTIEIVNNCPTGQDGNKDRITILDIIWEGAAEVHTHEYTSTTTATCTAAGITTYTCSCGDTYTEETEKLGHVDENLDIDCDRKGCTGKVAPAADSVLSNFTANSLGSKLSTSVSYYVEGTIVEVLDAKNGIFLIDDGTGEKFYFRLPKNAEGVSHANWEIKLVLGDKVQVYGKINKFSSPTAPNGQYWPAMQSPVVTLLEQHPHDFTSVPATCFYPAYCACGYDNGVSLGHTDGNSDNICDSCGYSTSSLLEEVKTHFQSIKDTDKVDNTNGTATFDGTEFVITVTKGTSTLNSNGSNHMRMNKGNDITIAAKNGNKIVSITFVPVSSSYLDELEAFLQTTEYKDTYTVNGIECTIQLDNLDSIELINGNKVQRIASVKIVYESASTTEA